MDKIIIDDKFNKIVELWSMCAENKRLEHMPFVEIQIIENIKGEELTTIVKDGRVIQKIQNKRIVIKYELKNGKMEFVKTTFNTIGSGYKDEFAKKTLSNLGFLFAFISNYNLEENHKARGQVQIYKFLMADTNNKRVSKSGSKDEVKEGSKVYNSENIFTKLVTIAPVNKLGNKIDNKRKYDRTCLGWEVKGYYRTYKKTGKKIWVEPFRKGDKSISKDKIYKI